MRTAIDLELLSAGLLVLTGVLALTGMPKSYTRVATAAFAIAVLLMLAAVVSVLSEPSFLSPR